jgi:putative ABC transport system permease protein
VPEKTARLSALSAQVAALSTVGAILGIATIVAIGGVIFGPGTAGTQLHAFGRNVLTITAGDAGGGDPAGAGRPRSLTIADVDAIARGVPDIAALSRAVFGTAPVGAGGQDGQIPIQGVDPSFAQVTSDTVAQGTFFTTQDASSANRVAVLGQTLSGHLFQNGQAPIGATIRIRNVPFTVIGVLAAQRTAVADNPDDAVLIPFQTGQIRLFGANALDAVLVQVADANQTDTVSQDVEQLLRQRHQVRAGQPDGFTIRASPSAPAAGVGSTATQALRQVLDLARQYGCEAKGLCARTQA